VASHDLEGVPANALGGHGLVGFLCGQNMNGAWLKAASCAFCDPIAHKQCLWLWTTI
jgi:hypothetical protein